MIDKSERIVEDSGRMMDKSERMVENSGRMVDNSGRMVENSGRMFCRETGRDTTLMKGTAGRFHLSGKGDSTSEVSETYWAISSRCSRVCSLVPQEISARQKESGGKD
jgi:hypothetical protein